MFGVQKSENSFDALNLHVYYSTELYFTKYKVRKCQNQWDEGNILQQAKVWPQ